MKVHFGIKLFEWPAYFKCLCGGIHYDKPQMTLLGPIFRQSTIDPNRVTCVECLAILANKKYSHCYKMTGGQFYRIDDKRQSRSCHAEYEKKRKVK